MELDREEFAGLDISSLATVLTYAYSGAKVLIVLVRVDLGSDAKPIAGSVSYGLQVKLDGVAISPISNITVASGQTRAVMQSRQIVIEPGDTLTVHVLGAPADVDIWATVALFDMTPAQVEDIQGTGTTVVDHDYGGTDALQAAETESGAPLDGVQIRAYLATNWNTGLRTSPYVVAVTRTNVLGRWESPMLLDPADYVLVYSKQGSITPRVVTLTVS